MSNSSMVVTPEFRASYVHIWTPQKSEEGQDVYSVTMIFPPDADLSGMKRIAVEAKESKFGKDATGKFKSPFRKGTEEEFNLAKNPEFRGNIVVPARSYGRPVGVVGRDKKPIVDKNLLYSGCFCIASVVAYGYERKGNRGVAFGLQNLMVVRQGEPLVSMSNPEEDFKAIDTSQWEEEDPFKGLPSIDDLDI